MKNCSTNDAVTAGVEKHPVLRLYPRRGGWFGVMMAGPVGEQEEAL